VVITPDGLALTGPEAALLPPLSALSVQSMADFSRRLPPRLHPGQQVDAAGIDPEQVASCDAVLRKS
jgi:hypothetical protein